jgi:beta-glucosidase
MIEHGINHPLPVNKNILTARAAGLLAALTLIPLSVRPASAQERPAYLDESKSIEARMADLLPRLTLEEKISMVHAESTFDVAGVPRLGIPKLWMDDGPMGVREEVGEGFRNLNRQDDFATAMPATIGLAATFNNELAHAYGRVIGEEAKQRNKNVMLGPSLNIQRTPLCGRNFEYLGEDPFLTARIAVNYIQGEQVPGVASWRSSAGPSTWRWTSARCARFTCPPSAPACRRPTC